MASYKIFRKDSGEYVFRLQADNGEIIITSDAYLTKNNCISGIEEVRIRAPFDQNYDRKINHHGKYYFTLKSSNGKILAQSDMYESMAGREYGITAVKRYAVTASISQ